ncbi:hypothetical protein ACFQ36_05950 [Arthrobacter sp. GCM10027362]|uniref:hypothetical protein n=1 Tax=Arthrobacter sp. GCM10027362 TaxID=3273379 RepID=UPI003640364F
MNADPLPAGEGRPPKPDNDSTLLEAAATAAFRDTLERLKLQPTPDADRIFREALLKHLGELNVEPGVVAAVIRDHLLDSMREIESWTEADLPELHELLTRYLGEDKALPEGELSAMLEAAWNVRCSMAALGPAMAAVRLPASPALAGAIQATENLWRSIREEWGLPGSQEVSRLLGAKTANRSYASDQRLAGKIIGIRRGQAYAYPGFQFDRRTGRVLAVIPRLIAAAREIGLDDEDLVFWLCSPSGYFGGDRPVDHLGEPDQVLEKLRLSETVEW